MPVAEWYGIGGESTNDKPIPGGFARLEEMYKAKWRKHLDGAQARHFTRIRLIIEGIRTMAEVSEMTVEVTRDQLESEWSRLKKSPGALVAYLQAEGYIKKAKSWGRHT